MNILANLLSIQPLVIFKIFFLLIEFFYISFALIIFRQQKLMAQTIDIPVSSFFRLLALINFIGSIIVFLLSLLLLS